MKLTRDSSLSAPPEADNVPTLRDLFAAATLIGIFANPDYDEIALDERANEAYRQADLMLKERGK